MVTKFKKNGVDANELYVDYIKKQIKINFPLWKESYCIIKDKCNSNFGVGYIYNNIKISFVKDKGSLELWITKNGKYPKNFSWEKDIRQGIIKSIPDINPKWCCLLCKEIIDFYINFLKERFDTFVWED